MLRDPAEAGQGAIEPAVGRSIGKGDEMPVIPSSINGVAIEFAPDVTNDALQMLIDGLTHTIRSDVAPGYTLAKIWISSVKDKHTCPSRHVTGNAADLSRINGKKIVLSYQTDQEVRAIVDALQNRFETYLPNRRENFGPTIKLKQGQPFDPGEPHDDHVHFSVSGPHNCPSPNFLMRMIQRLNPWRKRAEICSHGDTGDVVIDGGAHGPPEKRNGPDAPR
jgi:hypothetical protein